MHLSKIFIIIILAFGTCQGADAQKFTDRLKSQKQGEGSVTVNQSKEIDELVNGKSASTNTVVARPNPVTAKPNNSQPEKKQVKESKPEASKKVTAEVKPDNSQEVTVDTRKKVIRNGHKVTGYRIQVFSGRNSRADKIKANDVGTRLKTLFPDQSIYVHFYNPRWICRMGNYRTYQDAQNMLNEVKAVGYSQACIVKGQITVQD